MMGGLVDKLLSLNPCYSKEQLFNMSDDDWGFSSYGLNLNIRRSSQVEGFYAQLHDRHKFLFSDDTVIDINFAITDAMRVVARRMCRDPNPEWPEMIQMTSHGKKIIRACEVAIVQEWRSVQAPPQLG